MFNKRNKIIKIIWSLLCDIFEYFSRRKNGAFSCREGLFPEASTCIELLYLWDSLCGKPKLVVGNGNFHFSPAWQEKGEGERDNDYGIIRGSSQGKICCFACGADVSLMLSRLIFISQGAEFSQQTITRKFLVSK
jgi:hypothetical protein